MDHTVAFIHLFVGLISPDYCIYYPRKITKILKQEIACQQEADKVQNNIAANFDIQ